jgi:hypothetical protein
MKAIKRFFYAVVGGVFFLIFILGFLSAVHSIIWPDINDSPPVPGIYWFGMIFCFVFSYNGITLPWHFDKAFKKKVIAVSEKDDSFGFSPIAPSIGNKMRLFRASTYASGILLHYAGKRFRATYKAQSLLANSPEFIRLITPWYKFQAFASVALVLLSILIFLGGAAVKYLGGYF